MVITPNIINNSLELSYNEHEDFDPFILVSHEKGFEVLNPKELITVNLIGYVPIEIPVYICEVSKHCHSILLQVHDDRSTYGYFTDIIRRDNIKNIYHSFLGDFK